MEDPRNVGEEEDALCAEPDRERGRHLVRVHVQRAAGEGRDDGHAALLERGDDLERPRRDRLADEPELGHLLRLEADLVAGERKRVRPDRRAHGGVDFGETLAHDLERLQRRDAASLDEANLETAALHLLRDLRAGAVHDAYGVPERAQLADDVGGAADRRAADLQHDAHERYSALMRT